MKNNAAIELFLYWILVWIHTGKNTEMLSKSVKWIQSTSVMHRLGILKDTQNSDIISWMRKEGSKIKIN